MELDEEIKEPLNVRCRKLVKLFIIDAALNPYNPLYS